jgi:uncharacterized membrane protein YagU involved in acid resistance
MSTAIALPGRNAAFKTILLAWIVAGILDMSAAIIVYDFVLHKTTALKILKSIASGLFGKQANAGGDDMAVYGLILHFIIALLFTVFYFLIFPYVPFLKRNRILSGLIYGAFVWCVMNLGVLPLIAGGKIPTNWISISRAAVILMICIGLPIALIIGAYYQRKPAH